MQPALLCPCQMYFVGEGTTEVRIYEEPDPSAGQSGATPDNSQSAALRKRTGRSFLNLRKKNKMEEVQDIIGDLTNMPFRVVGVLSAGQYFGEYSCMLGEPRIATVVATSYCELYRCAAGMRP
jgi:hypothetical protein